MTWSGNLYLHLHLHGFETLTAFFSLNFIIHLLWIGFLEDLFLELEKKVIHDFMVLFKILHELFFFFFYSSLIKNKSSCSFYLNLQAVGSTINGAGILNFSAADVWVTNSLL